MIRGIRSAICWLTFALLSAADGWASEDWPVLRNREPSATSSASLDVQYFQVGCLLTRYGDDYLLTDPFFSNPSLWRLPFPPDIDWSRIRGILVGHGHYDHILDAPFVLEKADAGTELYGSRTVINVLQPLVSGDRLRAAAWKGELLKSGEFEVGDPLFCFQPILSEHAPLFGNFVFPRGHIDEPPERPPNRVWGWKVGQTLTYLIDVMPDDAQSGQRPGFESTFSPPPVTRRLASHRRRCWRTRP